MDSTRKLAGIALLSLVAGCGGGSGAAGSSSGASVPLALPTLSAIAATAAPGASAPVGVPSAAATAASGSGSLSSTNWSAANYLSIVNGQSWPASFRPYAGAPWNAALPASPVIDAANTSNVRSYMSDTVDHIAGDTHNDYSHPVYVATASDPLVTAACSGAQYGCYSDQSGHVTAFPAFHVPAAARPAGGTDAHFAVVQPDGTEYDFWETGQPGGNWTNGATLTAGIGVQTSILGSGVPVYASATSGAALAAGLIRFDELARGTIPHAIFLDFPCTQGLEYPATTGSVSCGGGGVPMGALIYLNLSDAQINALPATTIAPYLLPILHALHQYGGYAMDAYGGSASGAPFWEYESFTQYSSYGQAYPGTAFAVANGYSGYLNPSYLEYAGGPIRWSQLAPYVEVLAPCYARAAC
ncbi:MAG: hypothetical protein ABSH03_04210 [Candidatus Lustribacter sp.]